jgi:hypothetical protein
VKGEGRARRTRSDNHDIVSVCAARRGVVGKHNAVGTLQQHQLPIATPRGDRKITATDHNIAATFTHLAAGPTAIVQLVCDSECESS